MTESLSKIDTNNVVQSSMPLKAHVRQENVEKSIMEDMNALSSKSLKDAGIFAFQCNSSSAKSSEKIITTAEEDKIFVNLLNQFIKDRKEVGIEQASQKYLKNIREQFFMLSLEKKLPSFLNEGELDTVALDNEFKKISKIQTDIVNMILNKIPDDETEKFMLAVQNDILTTHKSYLYLIENNLPKNIDEEQAKKVFSSVDKYSENQVMGIRDYFINNNADLISLPKLDYGKTTEKFLHDFWRTSKGKDILPWYKNGWNRICDVYKAIFK